MKRAIAVLASLALPLAGCAAMPASDIVEMATSRPGDAFTRQLDWQAQSVNCVDNERGQYQVLAERSALVAGKRLVQALYVRILWPIEVGISAKDESTLNARIGYLVRTDPPATRPATAAASTQAERDGPLFANDHPDSSGKGGRPPQTLYYEGPGHVYIDYSTFGGGRRQFHVRRAALRLARAADRDGPDPLGELAVEADLAAGVIPDAAKTIQQFRDTISKLEPVRNAAD